MAAERQADVLAVHGEQVQLKLLPGCTDCLGCRGGCDIRRMVGAGDEITLAADRFERVPQVGQRVRLVLAERALLEEAWRAYGLPLLGLILGAAAGFGLATTFQLSLNGTVAAGLVLGTFAGMYRSKRTHRPLDELRVLPF